MANSHRFQIARAERGVIRSQKAAGRRRGSEHVSPSAVAAGVELSTSSTGALGLAAKKSSAASASADRALTSKFVLMALAILAGLIIIDAILGAAIVSAIAGH